MQNKVHGILKSQREQKRFSLQSVHQETKISTAYLEALETGRWDVFPAEVYLLGFLTSVSAKERAGTEVKKTNK